MNGTWERIIKAGISAPSGDNSQPWEFEFVGDTVRVHNDPARDLSLYNFSQQASRVAIGCCIENMRIAAQHEGYELQLSFFPDPNDPNAIFDCALIPATKTDNALSEAISARTSNRKKYTKEPLTDMQKKSLVASILEFSNIGIEFAERGAVSKAGEAASVNERVVLGNKALHDFLFGHITWNEAEDSRMPGFFVKTLELQGPQAFVFRLLRYWPIQRALNLIGMQTVVAHDNAKVYAHSGAIVALVAPFGTALEQVTVGRAYERLWLTATSLGLAFQPLAGISLLHQKIAAGNSDGLSINDISLIEDAYQDLSDMFSLDERRTMPLLFRIGKAGAPSARTRRYPPRMRAVRTS